MQKDEDSVGFIQWGLWKNNIKKLLSKGDKKKGFHLEKFARKTRL